MKGQIMRTPSIVLAVIFSCSGVVAGVWNAQPAEAIDDFLMPAEPPENDFVCPRINLYLDERMMDLEKLVFGKDCASLEKFKDKRREQEAIGIFALGKGCITSAEIVSEDADLKQMEKLAAKLSSALKCKQK